MSLTSVCQLEQDEPETVQNLYKHCYIKVDEICTDYDSTGSGYNRQDENCGGVWFGQ